MSEKHVVTAHPDHAMMDTMHGSVMKAAVCEGYGPPEVVRIKDVPQPVPAAGEVLIRSAATTVNSGDARMRGLRVPRGMGVAVRLKFGLTKPKQPIFGFDVAGRIEAVGPQVTQFRPGDRVVASRDLELGCHAEYIIVPEQGAIATIPDATSETDAVALCFGGSTALHFFGRVELAPGQSVLVNGASGAVGAIAVQLAKHKGAEVTAVCSGTNAAVVRSLGADHVVDYTTEDFTNNGQRYDVIMDNQGNATYGRVKGSLVPGGKLLMVYSSVWPMIAASWQKAVVAGTASISADHLRTLMALTERGALKPVIDRVLPFGQIVDAHRRVDSGHKVGSLVLRFDHDG
jgi:NADPH:quinone reductase-like Zn-dependent oxidoreductase